MQETKKRIHRLLLLAMVLLSIFGVGLVPAKAQEKTGGGQQALLVDQADVLTDEEENELSASLQKISNRQECAVIVVTVNDLDGKSAQEYADDYYDENDYGYGEDNSGILFLIGMNDRKWAITTYGYGITAFTDYGLGDMEEQLVPYLRDGEYMDAFETYASLCDDFLTQARDGHPYDADTSAGKKTSAFMYVFWLIIAMLLGFVIALLLAFAKKSRLKSVNKQVAANAYKKSGSMSVTTQEDHFINSIVTRRVIPRNDEQSSGGSSTHASSSGRSHGGNSGSF